MKQNGNLLKTKSNGILTTRFDSLTDSVRFKLHLQKWKQCDACPIAQKTKILYRGTIPCEVLIIGEAPGTSEHTLKIPFAPASFAGSVLQQIIDHSIYPKSYCLTNSVACTPFEENGTSIRIPKAKEYEPCSDRLQELILIAKPKYIIAAGRVAAKALKCVGIPHIEIVHPSVIALQGEKGTEALNRAILIIKEAIHG